MMNNKNLDVLVIGDALIDTYIKLRDDHASLVKGKDGDLLAMPFGAKLPFDFVEIVAGVGNASNAAVSLTRLGIDTGLVSNIGADDGGREIIKAYHEHGIDTTFVHANKGKESSRNYILWYKQDRSILIKHVDYNYEWPRFRKSDIPKWMYLTSITKDTAEYHDEISDFLHEYPDIKVMFQPGTYQIEEGASRFKKLYKRAHILVLNREEAAKVGGGKVENVHDLFDKLHLLGPKVIVITDGPKGSYASSAEGRFFMPAYPDPKPPLERTGAGDAFASTFMAAIVKGETVQDALRWGPISSMSVVQQVGPQHGLLTEAELQKLLKDAPGWYKASPM